MLGKEKIRPHAHCLAPVPKPQPSCPVPLIHKGSPELTLAKIDLLILSGTAAELPCLQHFYAYMMSIDNVVSKSTQGERHLSLSKSCHACRLQFSYLVQCFTLGHCQRSGITIRSYYLGTSRGTLFFKLVLGIKQCCVCGLY